MVGWTFGCAVPPVLLRYGGKSVRGDRDDTRHTRVAGARYGIEAETTAARRLSIDAEIDITCRRCSARQIVGRRVIVDAVIVGICAAVSVSVSRPPVPPNVKWFIVVPVNRPVPIIADTRFVLSGTLNVVDPSPAPNIVPHLANAAEKTVREMA